MSPSRRSCFQATLAAIGAVGLAPIAIAQAEPGVIRGPAVNNAFPTPPHHNLIYTDRLPGDPPGVFTCALTWKTGPTVLHDVVIGSYDQTAGTFTPTAEANAFNTALAEVGLTLEPGLGRYAVFFRLDAAQQPIAYLFSARSGAGVPFPAPVAISGVPAGTQLMALGWVAGKLELFYEQAGVAAIVMHDLDITNLAAPALTGTPQVVARPITGGQNVWPTTTITGPDGDVEGLLYMEWTTPADTKLVFQSGLDPTRPGSVVVSGCGPGCAVGFGAVAGGRILFVGGTAAPLAIQDVEVAWLLGDVVAPGGTADVFGAVSSAPGATTMILLSTGVIPKVKLPSPLDVGYFALDPATSIYIGNIDHADASQRGQMSFTVPNNPRLLGFDGALQGLSIDAIGWPIALTNTAWLSVR